jgi:hypothetical protein
MHNNRKWSPARLAKFRRTMAAKKALKLGDIIAQPADPVIRAHDHLTDAMPRTIKQQVLDLQEALSNLRFNLGL